MYRVSPAPYSLPQKGQVMSPETGAINRLDVVEKKKGVEKHITAL